MRVCTSAILACLFPGVSSLVALLKMRKRQPRNQLRLEQPTALLKELTPAVKDYRITWLVCPFCDCDPRLLVCQNTARNILNKRLLEAVDLLYCIFCIVFLFSLHPIIH